MKTRVQFIILGVLALLFNTSFSQNFTQITFGLILGEEGGRNYDCAWADYNNDEYPDLYVVNNYDEQINYLFRNDGDGSFSQIYTGEVVTDGGGSYGCAWGDYNNDGYVDLFVCNYGSHNGLYTNNGDETFAKVTAGAIVSNGGNSTCADWGDYDNDGYLDLYVTNRDQPNFLYHNNGDETFTKITGQIIVSESKNSGSGAWGDYDGDGNLDMFVANSGPDYNSLFHNNGDGTFSKIEEEPFISDSQNFDLVCWGDIDNDGDLDLFTAPGMLPYNFDLYLYKNNGDATFSKITDLPQSGINSAGGASMADFDNDGDLDIFIMAYDGNNIILENDGSGNFTQNITSELASEGGYYKDASWADYNSDGSLDIYVPLNNYFGGYNVFFENIGNTNYWLKVKCEGTTSNALGIGAVVTVYQDFKRQTRVISNQQIDIVAHFGLAMNSLVDSISVFWPVSQNTDVIYNVLSNQQITITESPSIGISETNNNNLFVYPNPASTKVFIKNAPETSIDLLNMAGIIINSFFCKSEICSIGISNLKSGTYFIRIKSKQTTFHKKIIIQ
jgi:hypothetical protein